jgi:large conductance mechanosensitive channel
MQQVSVDAALSLGYAFQRLTGGAAMLSGFKQFILRGNVVDLAVGVVIGAAFGTVVTSFTKAFLTPLIGLVAHRADFANVAFKLGSQTFAVGDFINAVISFLLISAAVYFLVVVPVNALISRLREAPASADPTTRKCPECLSEIPIGARRCAHCAVALGVAAD